MSSVGKKWFLVINPASNRGGGAKAIPRIRKILSDHHIDHDILVTTQSSEALPYVMERAYTHDVIIAAGGDGTVHEVVNGMMQARAARNGETPKAALGVIPIGSGNDFVKMVGIPKDLESAVAILVQGTTKPIDVGQITVDGTHTRYFDNNVGIGFDAFVNYECVQIHYLRGVLIYLAGVLMSLFKFQHPDVAIAINGQNLNKKILLMTTGNGTCSGGGFYITPEAKIDDGLFDVCVVESRSKPAMLRDLPKVMKGTHIHMPDVTTYKTTDVRIQSQTALPIHADGEVVSMDAHEVRMTIIPAAIRAIVA